MSQTVAERFWAKVDKAGPVVRAELDACWVWTAHTNRYGIFALHGRATRAHRVAFELANGAIPDGLSVLHACDNPRCCNPSHLFLGTQLENVADREAKGRSARGERVSMRGARNGTAKLRDADVVAIRLAAGSQAAIAARFGITQTTVSRIRRRLGWRHVAEQGGTSCTGVR